MGYCRLYDQKNWISGAEGNLRNNSILYFNYDMVFFGNEIWNICLPSVPDGMYLREMNEADAIAADSVWPNRHPGSTFFMKRIAKWNANVGLYRNDGKMVAWCLRLQAGPLGALQVGEEFKRNGYGSIVCRAITRKMGQHGEDVFACVSRDNTPSVRTFEKIGFKAVDKAHWLRTFPTVAFSWNENE